MNKTKVCITCNKRKLRKYYYPRNKGHYWISAECTTCTSKSRRKRYEKQLGRKLGSKAIRYSKKEFDLITSCYKQGMSYSTMVKKFPNRSRHALESKLSETKIAGLRQYQIKRETKIESIVKAWLKDLGFSFKFQRKISRMLVDFCRDKLVIEVMGSFWHCDKKLYPKGPKYKNQKIAVKRDVLRKKTLLSLGYSIIYIWEYDIEHTPEKIKKALQVVLNSDIWDNNGPISVELLRDNTEITNSITKGELVS